MSELFKKQAFKAPAAARVRKVIRSPSPDVLRRWRQPDCLLSLWERDWTADLARRLDALAYDELPQARFTTTAADAEVKIEAALCDSALRDDVVIGALAADIEALISRFAVASGAARVDVRLEAVRNDACRYFHVDNIAARLTTTYIGRGTIWVDDASAADAIRLQDAFVGPTFEMPRFAVGLYAGSKSRGHGLVHRSPRLSGAGQFRLFLCLTHAAG